MPALLSHESLGFIGMALVAMVFVFTALAKAVDPRSFTRHVRGLRLLPARETRTAVYGLIAFESAWGIALITKLSPGILLPATLVLLISLSALTYWSTSTGRSVDCGCYGTALQVTPAQSLLLNALYASAILYAYLSLENVDGFTPWKAAAALAAGAGAGLLAFVSDRRVAEGGGPLVNLEPLLTGRRWRSAWAGGGTFPPDQEVLVVYLGPTCPHCQLWVRVLNVVHLVPGLPAVIGVVSVDEEKKQEFVETFALRFPVRTVPDRLMNRLAAAVPTTVLISENRIQEKWVGQMPETFLQRFRAALFPFAARSSLESDAVAGR